ncbi:right-handed parallel beta-helix repeat-containing protein [Patulibacter defluvii]|uniref:right-handed parallel beta-helix repeat-containing protein n=1 Tax=Patulibacter defluvii TaxID=3095358 RepID=UPI002A7607FC|nr:right-handed parallel beta-helix repeat-containing protein [Patulibacter sp. DM4]
MVSHRGGRGVAAAVVVGAALLGFLGAPVAADGASSLRVSVSPPAVPAGPAVTVTVRVTRRVAVRRGLGGARAGRHADRAGRARRALVRTVPVPGARVALGATVAHSDRHGRARLRVSLPPPTAASNPTAASASGPASAPPIAAPPTTSTPTAASASTPTASTPTPTSTLTVSALRAGRRGHATLVVTPPVYRLDCSAPQPGDGGPTSPLNRLEQARGLRLTPGAQLLLRRATACVGTLAPQGGGAPGAPAIIGAWGSGPAPRIDARGPDAVRLEDQSHLVVQDLELTNRGDGTRPRRGIGVAARRTTVRGLVLRRLHVHDVGGDLAKGPGGSGGIQLDVLGGATTSGRFDDVLITANRVVDVRRSGIRINGTGDPRRPPATAPWPAASTAVVIRGNRVDGIGGDGIVPSGTVDALVEDNVVSRGNRDGRNLLDPRGMVCNAGIWAFHANGTVIRRNEVFGMAFSGCDGTGFDVDYDQDATLIEANYSHDNAGGFLLLCGDARPRRAEVRFNLSVDDGAALAWSPCDETNPLGALDGIRIVQNTIVGPLLAMPSSGPALPLPVLPNVGGLVFRNNLLVATAPQLVPLPCGFACSHNLTAGPAPPAGTAPLTGDPRFADPTRRGPGRERVGRGFVPGPGSPALGAGTPLGLDPAVRDYFGRPLPARPTVGFAQP